MPNLNGNAYGLTTLAPILNRDPNERSYATMLKELLDALPTGEHSPMAAVPETYLCRFFVLDNVVYQGLDIVKALPLPVPASHDRLKSAYLAFTANFHGPDLDQYLWGMWDAADSTIRQIWKYCVGFEQVHDAASFAKYLRRCQVETTFYFNGSTDESLAEQLKGLYLKQELAKFAFDNQGKNAEELQAAFFDFVRRTQPEELDGPSWRAGATSLERAVIGEASPEALRAATPGTPSGLRPTAKEPVQQNVGSAAVTQ
ncbi:MAG TPA: hypothetical protein VF331_21900 [Polyangiales bacterium]